MSLSGWFVAYLARWLPHRSARGLFPLGTPGPGSPVIVTCNFSLTVRRLRRALAGQDAWLLVADSDGINVWCAACGGHFTADRVIDALKVARLADKVNHRNIILPPLSAPGMDCKAIRQETGFQAHFGPVYARDLPAYLDAGGKKTESMCRFRFDLRHRLDMLLSMNFPIYAVAAIVLAVLAPQHLAGFTLLFWAATTALYLLIRVIPGKTGWHQAIFAAGVLVLAWAAIDTLLGSTPLRHGGWFLATFAVFFAAGFDLAGIASARKSDAEQFLSQLGCKRLGTLFQQKDLGTITLDRDKCSGCGTCREICPLGVFGPPDQDHKTTIQRPAACFACGACVKQCLPSALTIRAE